LKLDNPLAELPPFAGIAQTLGYKPRGRADAHGCNMHAPAIKNFQGRSKTLALPATKQ
jgi:hypothetical protein